MNMIGGEWDEDDWRKNGWRRVGFEDGWSKTGQDGYTILYIVQYPLKKNERDLCFVQLEKDGIRMDD